MTTKSELLAQVDALIPAIAARADEADRNRAVHDETIAELTQAGVFATIAPKVYGGYELGLDAYSEIIRKISAVSPSTGWVTSFLAGAAWRLLTFSKEAQEEIYGDRNYVLGAGSAVPIQKIERVSGGYRISGRSSWNSGASHAEWFTMNGLIFEEGKAPDMLIFALPRKDVAIIDNWHIMGMQATASNDLVVEDLFVPEHRAARFFPALAGHSSGHAIHANPMYHIPFLPFAMNEVLPVIVGTHRGAANALEERTQARAGTISGARATDKVAAQIRMAKALARADHAENILEAMVSRNMADRPNAWDLLSRADMKLQASVLTEYCLDSINEMARGVGGDSFRQGANFQRFFRDINVVARHAFLDPDTAAESYGKLKLGLPITDPLI